MHFKKYVILNPAQKSPWESLDPKSFPYFKTLQFSERHTYVKRNEIKCPTKPDTIGLLVQEKLNKLRVLLPKVTQSRVLNNMNKMEQNKIIAGKHLVFGKQYENCKRMVNKNGFKRKINPIKEHNSTKRKSSDPASTVANLLIDEYTIDLTAEDPNYVQIIEKTSKSSAYFRSQYKIPAGTTIGPITETYVPSHSKIIEPSIEIKRIWTSKSYPQSNEVSCDVGASSNVRLCDMPTITMDKRHEISSETESTEPGTILKLINESIIKLRKRLHVTSPQAHSLNVCDDQDSTILTQIGEVPCYNFDINQDGDVIVDNGPLAQPSERESPGCSEGKARNKIGVILMKKKNGYKASLL